MHKKLFFVISLIVFSSVSVFAQQVVNGNSTLVPGAYIAKQLVNAASTGTTVNKIAKLTGAGTVIISGTSDTSGMEGIVAAGAGTSGNASIAVVGRVNCVFDGATTQNDYVINSTTVAGDCRDGGSTPPTVQSFGRVLSTNASAGTYAVDVTSSGGNNGNIQGTITSLAQGEYLCANSTPELVNCVSGVGNDTQTGTTYAILGGEGGISDRGKFIIANRTADSTTQAYTIAQAGSTGFDNYYFFTVMNRGTGALTISPTTSTINGASSLTLLSGQSATIFSDNSNYFATTRGYGSGTSGSISGAIIGNGCDTGTVTVPGAASGMGVSVTPNTYPGAGITWEGYVSASNTITVTVCSNITLTPTASTYSVRVLNP